MTAEDRLPINHCFECNKIIADKPIGCVCHKYGSSYHEEVEWCSVACMDKSHPDTWDEPDEQQEESDGAV